MALTIRPADLEGDADPIIKALAASVNPRYDRARFEWLYQRNPDGRARAWVTVDPSTEEIVGTAAAIPRRVHVGRRVDRGWVLSDFCIAERYRALGPALQLQRACLASVASGEVPFCYDFPSAGMLAVYRRLGIAPALHLRRYGLPLRMATTIKGVKLPPALLNPIAAATGILVGFRLRRRASSDLHVSLHDGPLGQEFSELDEAEAERHAVCTYRSAEYLNWRFLANPFQAHEVVTARRDGALVAYAVIASDPEVPVIVDLFGRADAFATIRGLLAGALALLQARGARSVSITLAESHPWVAVLAELGFRPRERSPLVVYAPNAPAATATGLASSAWLLTSGDWDT
jgi:hypothetical protein